MGTRVYESMTRVRHYDCTVRVWAKETDFHFGPRAEVELAVVQVPRLFDFVLQAEAIAEALDRLPDISAYEILDERGNGAVVYPDWP